MKKYLRPPKSVGQFFYDAIMDFRPHWFYGDQPIHVMPNFWERQKKISYDSCCQTNIKCNKIPYKTDVGVTLREGHQHTKENLHLYTYLSLSIY